MNVLIADFYRSQSQWTDPGCYEYLFASLPNELGQIKQIIQGLLFHFLDGLLYCHKITHTRLQEIELRFIEKMLHQIMRIDNQALHCPRRLQNKLIASCREYALLACSMLRYQGIPARLRVVFNTYCRPHIFHDQVILEFWDSISSTWRCVDMRMTDVHIKHIGTDLKIDFFNLSVDQYIPASTAWYLIRRNPNCAQYFGDEQGNFGLWYVRDRLLQDLAAVNKVEMLIWDCWGMMHAKEDEISVEELSLLDEIAYMLNDPDKYFSQLTKMYTTNPRLKVSGQILNVSPALGKRMIDCEIPADFS